MQNSKVTIGGTCRVYRVWFGISTAALAFSVFMVLLTGSRLWEILMSASGVSFAGVSIYAFCLVNKFYGDFADYVSFVLANSGEKTVSREDILSLTEEQCFSKLTEVTRKDYEAEYLKTEAELHALQNQINPHFLYNTLELIRGRSLLRGMDDVADMAETLASLFRYSINAPGETATLSQELSNINDYMRIQKQRFGDRFEYHEYIDHTSEEILNCMLPVMTLQPLVENALMHGIMPKIGGGKLILRVTKRNDILEIFVEDDGVGMDDATLSQIRAQMRSEGQSRQETGKDGRRNMGIALRNVNQRIRLYYGKQYGLDIESTKNIGTVLSVRIPFRRGTEN
jgi:sensor histidine kinase YesM